MSTIECQVVHSIFLTSQEVLGLDAGPTVGGQKAAHAGVVLASLDPYLNFKRRGYSALAHDPISMAKQFISFNNRAIITYDYNGITCYIINICHRLPYAIQ